MSRAVSKINKSSEFLEKIDCNHMLFKRGTSKNKDTENLKGWKRHYM